MTRATVGVHSDSPAETERLGAALGTVLRPGDVLVLEGPLGAGKTCLVRGLVAGAGGDPGAVRSPTFVLHQPHQAARLTIHHIDLYRLGSGASIEVLDLDTLLLDGAVVIEWGGYADLTAFEASTVSIAGGDHGDNQRDLRLEQPAAAHLADAWASLSRAAAAP